MYMLSQNDVQAEVVPFKPTKYTKARDELFSKVTKHSYFNFDANEWVCTTCDGTRCKGSLPAQRKANSMQLESVTPSFHVELRSGKQMFIHGPAVNVPSKLDKVYTTRAS